MTTTYTTISDLYEQEIAAALDGVSENFDLDGFLKALQDADLIQYVDGYDADEDAYRLNQAGFVLVDDEPTFWELVEKFDK